MRRLDTIVSAVSLAAVSIGLAFLSPPHITSDHQRTGSNTVSSGDMSSGLMGLETPNDTAPELMGVISNRVAGAIEDVKIWFEKLDGTKLLTPGGACPVSALSTGSPQVAPATLASNSGGVSTFNLAAPIPTAAGSGHSYSAQVDSFQEPANYKIKMAFSLTKAAQSKHFEALGDHDFTLVDNSKPIDGVAPTIRDGVAIMIRNVDGARTMTGVKVTVTSNQSGGLTFTGGQARTTSSPDEPISGTTVSMTDSDKTIRITGLSLANQGTAGIWLDLSGAYTATTTFTTTALY
jgi:hypothetical protein